MFVGSVIRVRVFGEDDCIMPLKTVLRHATASNNSKENRRSIMCLHPVKLFGGVGRSDKPLTVKDFKSSERPINRDTTQCPAVSEPVAAPKRKLKRSFSLSRNFRMPKGPDQPRVKRYNMYSWVMQTLYIVCVSLLLSILWVVVWLWLLEGL